MEPPTADDIRRSNQDFYDATGNEAVRHAICAVCARLRRERDAHFSYVLLAEVPNAHRLRPHIPHPHHNLVHGMLLEERGLLRTGEAVTLRLCADCKRDLTEHARPDPPQCSLANGLWVGPTPWELAVLTLPERLLLAHVYPRVFVFKLHPANLHAAFPAANRQSAMRGNVSTYALDSTAIADMLVGRLMPRPPSILASVIAVTFIGRGKLSRHRLRSLFRVRRHLVLRALQWLNAHNPYYKDIDIDFEALNSLPEDDVPEDILGIVRQSEDVDVVEQERAGYHDVGEGDVEGDSDLVNDKASAISGNVVGCCIRMTHAYVERSGYHYVGEGDVEGDSDLVNDTASEIPGNVVACCMRMTHAYVGHSDVRAGFARGHSSQCVRCR